MPACTYVLLMIVDFKKRCPTFQMCVRLWVPNWGRRHSCWIKLPLREKKAPSPSDHKWTTTTGCAFPSQLAWSFLRFQLYLFVVLLCLLLPYSDLCLHPVGFLLTYFTFILRAFLTVCILFLQTSVLRAAGRTLHPNLVVISEELRAWGAFSDFHSKKVTVFLSVGLIRSSPGRLRLFTCSLFLTWAVHSFIPSASESV